MSKESNYKEIDYKRINILLRQDQYEHLKEMGLSVSGLLRDLVDDRFSSDTITISINKDVRNLYDKLISNFGSDDLDLNKYLVMALSSFMKDKMKELEKLQKEIANFEESSSKE